VILSITWKSCATSNRAPPRISRTTHPASLKILTSILEYVHTRNTVVAPVAQLQRRSASISQRINFQKKVLQRRLLSWIWGGWPRVSAVWERARRGLAGSEAFQPAMRSSGTIRTVGPIYHDPLKVRPATPSSFAFPHLVESQTVNLVLSESWIVIARRPQNSLQISRMASSRNSTQPSSHYQSP